MEQRKKAEKMRRERQQMYFRNERKRESNTYTNKEGERGKDKKKH